MISFLLHIYWSFHFIVFGLFCFICFSLYLPYDQFFFFCFLLLRPTSVFFFFFITCASDCVSCPFTLSFFGTNFCWVRLFSILRQNFDITCGCLSTPIWFCDEDIIFTIMLLDTDILYRIYISKDVASHSTRPRCKSGFCPIFYGQSSISNERPSISNERPSIKMLEFVFFFLI